MQLRRHLRSSKTSSRPHSRLLILYSCIIYRSHCTPHYPEYLSQSPGLVVLDLQLEHDHPLLRLGHMLHSIVVGPALYVDELTSVPLFGTGLHSNKGCMVVGIRALAHIREVRDWETPVCWKVCQTSVQGLLVCCITTPAV